jgi:hypothetical protein
MPPRTQRVHLKDHLLLVGFVVSSCEYSRTLSSFGYGGSSLIQEEGCFMHYGIHCHRPLASNLASKNATGLPRTCDATVATVLDLFPKKARSSFDSHHQPVTIERFSVLSYPVYPAFLAFLACLPTGTRILPIVSFHILSCLQYPILLLLTNARSNIYWVERSDE